MGENPWAAAAHRQWMERYGHQQQPTTVSDNRGAGKLPSLEELLARLDEEEEDDEVLDVPSATDLLKQLDDHGANGQIGSASGSTAPSAADATGNPEDFEVLDVAGDEVSDGSLPVVTRKGYLSKLAAAGKSQEVANIPVVEETALAVIPSVESLLQRLERDAAKTAEEEKEALERQQAEDVRASCGQALVEAPSTARTVCKKPMAIKPERDASGQRSEPSGSLSGLFRGQHSGKGLGRQAPGSSSITSSGRRALGEASRPISLRGKGKGRGRGLFGAQGGPTA